MNLCEIIKQARKSDKAIRQKDWPSDIFAYHGVDNLIRFSDSDKEISMAVATLLAENWELYNNATYHGENH